MTDRELLEKIRTVLLTQNRIDPYGYVANPDAVAQLIMDEVIEELNTTHERAVQVGYESGFFDGRHV